MYNERNIHSAPLERLYQTVYNIPRHFFFALQRIIRPPLPVDDADAVGIVPEARARIVERIEHDEVEVLALELSFGVPLFVIGLKGKAHQQLVFLFLPSQTGGDILCRLKMKRQLSLLFPSYLLRSEERRVGKECSSRWLPY